MDDPVFQQTVIKSFNSTEFHGSGYTRYEPFSLLSSTLRVLLLKKRKSDCPLLPGVVFLFILSMGI